jgi:hypothetical protein
MLTLNELYAAILDWIYGEDDSYANGQECLKIVIA